jgi:type III secretion protein L
MSLGFLIDNQRLQLALGRRILKADQVGALVDATHFIEQCQSVTRQVRHEAEALHEEERARGFAQGRNEGLAQCTERIAQTEAQAARYIAGLHATVADLALQVVRRMAPRIGARELIRELIDAALKEALCERFLVIKVHPDNREAVAARLEEIKRALPMVEFFDIVADAELERYACVLESECGVVKADWRQQIDAIEAAMKSELASAGRDSEGGAAAGSGRNDE